MAWDSKLQAGNVAFCAKTITSLSGNSARITFEEPFDEIPTIAIAIGSSDWTYGHSIFGLDKTGFGVNTNPDNVIATVCYLVQGKMSPKTGGGGGITSFSRLKSFLKELCHD